MDGCNRAQWNAIGRTRGARATRHSPSYPLATGAVGRREPQAFCKAARFTTKRAHTGWAASGSVCGGEVRKALWSRARRRARGIRQRQ
jgi:hypothetical protein